MGIELKWFNYEMKTNSFLMIILRLLFYKFGTPLFIYTAVYNIIIFIINLYSGFEGGISRASNHTDHLSNKSN